MLIRALLLLLLALPAIAAEPVVSEGQPAPAITVPLSDNESSTLAAISAKRPTVVLFWASWCPYCKAVMPHLQSILDEHGPEQVEVIAVNIREDDPADGSSYLASQGYDFLQVSDGDPVAEAWGVSGTPRIYLVGRDGTIVYDPAAHAVAPSRRSQGTAPKGHSAKAARVAPAWAAALRKAVDQQLTP